MLRNRVSTDPAVRLELTYYNVDTLRWKSNKYNAKHALDLWRFCKKNGYRINRETALHVIGMQTFTGLKPEWVEKNLPLQPTINR